MDDLLPWEISADTPAVEAAATGSAPPRREVAVSFSEHTATDHDALAGAQPDGLDWLGDLANNAAPSKPAPIMMATRLAAVTETATPTSDEDADPGDLDVNAQPMSFPSANAPATAPHEADVPRAPPPPPSTGVREVTREHPKDGPLTQDETLPTPPTASVTARDIRSELDADTTTISASHAPHTQEPRGAAPPPANGASPLPLTPLPTVLQSVPDREHDASDQAESTHSTSSAPPAVAVAAATSSSPTTPPPAPPIATTTSSSSSAAHAHTRARQSNRSSATPSTIGPAATTASSQTRQRASKATEGGRAGSLRPVVREPSQSLVKTTGKSRMSTTSRQSRSNSKADQQQQQRSSSTRQAAAASSKAAGPTYNRENFFFAGDDVGIEFGTGTTGLYASKATPVVAIDKSRSVTTRPGEKGPRNTTTTATGTTNRVQAEEANTFAATAPTGDHHHSHNNNNSSSGPCEATDGARAYFTSAFYTKVPQGYHESQWARKEEAFGDWRTTQLKHSTYYTYGRGGGKAGTTNTGANKTSAGGTPEAHCAEAGGDPWLDPVSFYTAEEAYAFECRRTAAIAAERRAKIKARDSQTADLEAKLSEQRRGYQRGVPTYLPDAYFRTTLEQERVTQLPGNHLTCSDPAAVITPRDHHKAQVAYRHYQDQVADDRVTLRQRDARKYHARIEKDIAQSRRELEAFKDAWLDGVPHVSRDDAFAKTRAAEENQRAQARVNAEESAFNRGVYALYRDEEEAQRREHLTYLRTKLPEASQSRLRELREKSARQAAEREEAAAAQRAQEKARALQQQQQRSKSTLSPTPPPHSTKPVTTTTTTATSAPVAAPSPVPIALPAARSFVSEVRQWQETFQTPNVAPPNAQDAEYRREWLRRLSGDRRGFKKETVELGKEQPGRVQQAVVDLLDQRAKTADGQRKENASLKERRLEVEAQNYAYATGMYEQNKDLLAKGRSARQEVAAERQMSATAQRHREKEVDALMSALDEEEMKRLKEAVMSTRS